MTWKGTSILTGGRLKSPIPCSISCWESSTVSFSFFLLWPTAVSSGFSARRFWAFLVIPLFPLFTTLIWIRGVEGGGGTEADWGGYTVKGWRLLKTFVRLVRESLKAILYVWNLVNFFEILGSCFSILENCFQVLENYQKWLKIIFKNLQFELRIVSES